MANNLLTPQVIAKEALMQLTNNLVFGNLVDRQFKNEFVKVGDTVTARKPNRFVAQDGATMVLQDVNESGVQVKIDHQKHIAWRFSSQELTLDIDQYSDRYIKPAIGALQQAIDEAIAAEYINIPNAVGVAGTTPSTFAVLAEAGKVLTNHAAPAQDRAIVVDPEAQYKLSDALKGVYQPQIAQQTLMEGTLGRIAGFNMYYDQNIKLHTAGAGGGTPLVNGAGQTGASLVTDGWTASTAILKKGDIITIAGVYDVNPISKQATKTLRHFVVTADVNSDASGNATIPISPGIVISGNDQNVDAAPADNAPITLIASHTANLAFHRNAITLVSVPLEMPDSVQFKAQEQFNGISVRILKGYDMTYDYEAIRLDVLFGVKTVYPDLAVRILG